MQQLLRDGVTIKRRWESLWESARTAAPPQPPFGWLKRHTPRAQRAALGKRAGLWSGGWPHSVASEGTLAVLKGLNTRS